MQNKASKNIDFFAYVFDSILGGVGRGFRRGLGPFWRPWAHFWRHFLTFVFLMVAKRVLGGSWGGSLKPFGGVWEGSGEDFGMFFGGLGESLEG